LGIGLHGGFQLWTSDGNRLLTQIPMKNQIQDKPYTFNSFTEYKVFPKSTTYDSLLCGDNYGQIYLVVGSDQSWKTKLIFNNSLTLTDIAYNLGYNYIACAYETGDILIMILKPDGNMQQIAKLDNLNSLPSLNLAIIQANKTSLLISGYINGEIKIHKLGDKPELVTSLGNHSRAITSLVVYNHYIVTCGDDCYVNIWKINSNLKLLLVTCLEIPNRIPVGLTVLPVSENKIHVMVACYDYNCLVLLDNIELS